MSEGCFFFFFFFFFFLLWGGVGSEGMEEREIAPLRIRIRVFFLLGHNIPVGSGCDVRLEIKGTKAEF